jgi:hypothetical protein
MNHQAVANRKPAESSIKNMAAIDFVMATAAGVWQLPI